MASPHLKSLIIENYRVFSEFNIEGFRRINLIGGTNGTGKTTLLESIFFLMDRGNIISIIRPLQWRNLPPTLSYAKDMLFSNPENSTLSIKGVTREGVVQLSYRWEPQKLPENQAIMIHGAGDAGEPVRLDAQTDSSMEGFTVEVKTDNIVRLKRGMISAIDGFQIVDLLNNPERSPGAIILSRYTMNLANDISQRYSEVARKGQKHRVVAIAKKINPEIDDLELFQVGPVALLHVRLKKGQMVPISLAGDGVLTMMSIGLAIMNAQKGVVILDEFEAAIHYSVLTEIWKFIADLAREYDCQIFAATHSRECIESAVMGACSNGRGDDLLYIRLDRLKDRVVSTKYTSKELIDAAQGGWEIR